MQIALCNQPGGVVSPSTAAATSLGELVGRRHGRQVAVLQDRARGRTTDGAGGNAPCWKCPLSWDGGEVAPCPLSFSTRAAAESECPGELTLISR